MLSFDDQTALQSSRVLPVTLLHLCSSSSRPARLSRPLSQASKAARKSLWIIICSAAASNMLDSCVTEGLQVDPSRLRAAGRLLEQLLMIDGNAQKNKLFEILT